jgi:hypothetical protein
MRAPREHGVRDLDAPGNAALPRLAAVSIIVAECGQRRGVPHLQHGLLRGKQARQRGVRRCDHRCSARGSRRRRVMDEDRRVTPLDAVVRVVHSRVNNRPEPLTRRIWCVRHDQHVDEDLVPLQHLVPVFSRSEAGFR